MMMKKHKMKLGTRMKLKKSCKNKKKCKVQKCKDWWHEKVVVIGAVYHKEISMKRDSVLRSLL
jgi:hypothetical protein